MTKKRIYYIVLLVVAYAIAFGIVLPWLISAKSTAAVVLGIAAMLVIIIVPTTNLVFNLIKNEKS